MSLASKIHPTLDYRAKTQAAPRYDLSDVYPQTGSRELKLDATKTNILEFELPPRCINLARTKLEFDLNVKVDWTEADAATSNLFLKTDSISFVDRIEVFTRSGVRLMDLDRQQLWSKLSNTYFQDPSKYAEDSSSNTKLGPFGDKVQTEWLRTYASENIGTPLNGGTLTDLKNNALNDVAIARDIYGALKPTSKSLVEATPWNLQKESGGAGQRNYVRTFSLDLGHFRESILSVDKTLFFGGQVLNVKIHVAGYDDFIFANVDKDIGFANNVSTDEQNATARETTIASLTIPISELSDSRMNATPIPEIKLQNVTMRCSFESNPVIIAQLKRKVMSAEGLSLFIPYTYANEQSNTASTGKQSQITRLNRGHGIRLHRLCWTVTPNDTAAAVLLKGQAHKFGTSQLIQPVPADNKMKALSSVKSYYTTLNNRRLQERDIEIQSHSNFRYSADSYNYAKSCLKGTVITTPQAHLGNWCHIDSFDGYDVKEEDHINIVTGIPLSDDMQYTIHADLGSLAPKCTVTTFAVIQRSLLLKADSISLV